MRRSFYLAFVAAFLLLVPASAQASFGIGEFDVTFTGPDGSPEMLAGSHPFAMTTSFTVASRQEAGIQVLEGALRDLEILEPAGFVGDATAVPRCSAAEFLDFGAQGGGCADSTAVGTLETTLLSNGITAITRSPLYNLIPDPREAAKLGAIVAEVPITIDLGLNPNPPYNIRVKSTNIDQILEFVGAKTTVWGVPADPAHDHLRGECAIEFPTKPTCPSDAPQRPFLTLPSSCQGPLTTLYHADSWWSGENSLEPGPSESVAGSATTHDGSSPPQPLGTFGCSALGFQPAITAKPTSAAASSPTGLDFTLDVQNEGLTSPSGVSQSDIKKVTVALPEAMSVNPALAEGLTACSEADLAREAAGSAPGEGCPDASKIGTVEVETPLLEQVLKGSLFLAKPYENPFGSLLGLYVVVKNPETGILLKLGGEVVPNETTGQLVSVFDNLPQLPFSHFRLHFREGQRSPLATPPACGTYTTQADLVPWANPETVLHDTASFEVTSGVGGGACPAPGLPPFKPGLVAGTLNNSAGSYSPLDLSVTRNDGEQEITGFSSLLPAGLTANLTGVPFCPQSAIMAAEQKTGAQELSSPSCPQASEIGHTLVGVGVGTVLAYNPGKLYMGGPYDGAPFSVIAITAAKVGPFDLGTVVVHLPLNIDPITAQVSIPSGAADQIPHIIKGIVVHIRDIRVYVNKPGFTINPTNCEPMNVGATVYGAGPNTASPADDVPSAVTDRFQTANCASLAFKPTFKVAASGKTSRKNGANLHVVLTYPNTPQGTQANIKSVHVELPKALPSRLSTLNHACADSVFNQNPANCPSESRVGFAKAVTPVLPVPLEGPAYFVSHGGQRFPELIVVLQGYGVTIYLQGETFISKAGITSSTFKSVPDVPVGSFELTLPEGPFSALAANTDLCASSLAMPTTFHAQNGAVLSQKTAIEVRNCPYALRMVGRRVHKRALTLKVSVPVAGRLVAAGKGISRGAKAAKGRSTLILTLKEVHAGKLRTKIALQFMPTSATGKQRGKKAKILRKSIIVTFP